jgi:hypothetical protein
VTELCQFFLGGSWTVKISVQWLSKPLYTVNNRGCGLILSKQTFQLKWKVPEIGKNNVFRKIGKSLIVNQPVQL